MSLRLISAELDLAVADFLLSFTWPRLYIGVDHLVGAPRVGENCVRRGVVSVQIGREGVVVGVISHVVAALWGINDVSKGASST